MLCATREHDLHIFSPPASIIMTMPFTRQILARCADWLAVAAAIALPWSTTVTAVFIALWVVSLVGSWDLAERLHEPWIMAGALPIALWALAVVGVLWATVPLAQRIDGLNSFHKLLAIPFLAIQFRDSSRGMYVLVGFLVSCTVLLLVSWGLVLLPELPWRGRQRIEGGRVVGLGIPVKDYISQATMFTLCILGLAEAAFLAWRNARPRLALALVLLAIVFLANILYAATSRTAFVALPVLLVLFAVRRLGWRERAGLLIAVTALITVAWPMSPYLRERTTSLLEEVRNYEPTAADFHLRRQPAGILAQVHDHHRRRPGPRPRDRLDLRNSSVARRRVKPA